MKPAFLSTSGLVDEEILRHLRALRLKENDEFYLLDGKGSRLLLRCHQLSKSRSSFESLGIEKKAALSPSVELCLSPPKGEALWQSITQSTELGIHSLRFFKSEHCQIKSSQPFSFERAQRVADAACEQCLQPWRVNVDSKLSTFDELLKKNADTQILFADESLSEKSLYGPNQAFKKSQRLRLFIGPEGGWSPSERQKLDAHGTALGLGPLILRVPTACVAALYQLRLLT